MIVDKNGEVSYWTIGGDRTPRENPGMVFKEKMQKQIAEAKEKDREHKALEERRLKKADSLQKLLRQMGVSVQDTAYSASSGEKISVSISDEAKQLYLENMGAVR